MTTQAVIVEIPNGTGDTLDRLEPALLRAVARVPGGEYDGSMRGQIGVTMYMYARDADALFDAVLPVLRSSLPGSPFTVVRRYGEPGAPTTITAVP